MNQEASWDYLQPTASTLPMFQDVLVDKYREYKRIHEYHPFAFRFYDIWEPIFIHDPVNYSPFQTVTPMTSWTPSADLKLLSK